MIYRLTYKQNTLKKDGWTYNFWLIVLTLYCLVCLSMCDLFVTTGIKGLIIIIIWSLIKGRFYMSVCINRHNHNFLYTPKNLCLFSKIVMMIWKTKKNIYRKSERSLGKHKRVLLYSPQKHHPKGLFP